MRFTRDPIIVSGPSRRFRLNVRRLRDRVVDLRYLSMHSSPGFPASLQTEAAPSPSPPSRTTSLSSPER